MSLLALPSLMFYIDGSDGDYGTNPSFETALALTTLGNMGTITDSCTRAKDLTATVNFFCSYGTLGKVLQMGLIKEGNSASSCQSNGARLVVSDSCNYSNIGDTARQSLDSLVSKNCEGNKVCNIDLKTITWPSTCSTNTTVFLTAQCIPLQTLGADKEDASYVIIAFDIVSMFFIWICFQIHGTFEELEVKEIDGVVLDGADFTVDVSNIPQHKDYKLLKAQVWKHIETMLEGHPEFADRDENDVNAHKIAQCNLSLNRYSVLRFYKLRLNYEKKEKIIALKQALLDKSSAKEEKKEKMRKKLEAKMEDIKRKKDQNEKMIESQRVADVKANRIYLTMQSMEGKQRVLNALKPKKFRRCCNRKKFEQRYINGKWLEVYEAPQPSIILWENLSVTAFNRFLRILLVSLISGGLIAITFVLMVLCKNYQSDLTSSYNASSCPDRTISKEDAYRDSEMPESERQGLMHCYCLAQYNDIGTSVRDISFSDGVKHCDSWYSSYITAVFLIYLLTITMQFVNVALKTILRIASKIERREDKTEEVISNTFKMFVTQLINSVILLLIVNFNLGFIPSWFPLFGGDYDDFTAEWYTDVGVAILLMMFFSIFSAHVANA